MEQERPRSRALAGKALLVFLIIMALLTLGSRTLEEMTIATVSRTTTQRGALEKRITGIGILEAMRVVPVILTDSARVLEVSAAVGAHAEIGDPLLTLSYQALIDARQADVDAAKASLSTKQRALDWSAAALSPRKKPFSNDRRQGNPLYRPACQREAAAEQAETVK